MNKNIKLAVAGAIFAATSAAQAGIIIPAGDWTLDVNGNVNAFAIMSRGSDNNAIVGGIAQRRDTAGEKSGQAINTGLLPAWLGFTGTTRQNDVDVSFTISMQPNVSDNDTMGDVLAPLFRQSFLTFGDKSWGSFKLGKDIGIFASDAILNDMTLLGVGGAGGVSGTQTTLGGIGSGYIYAGWKGQVAYTTPNMNGFQATVGIVNPNQGLVGSGTASAVNSLHQDRFGLEGKASYSFTGDVNGKIWVGGASYKVKPTTAVEYTADVYDIGANVNAGNFGLTGYYYNGDGVGSYMPLQNGASAAGVKRDSDGGYVQATYILPTKTKIGLAYGISSLDTANAADNTATSGLLFKDNERITLGAYHPLTKHLNLVAEYNDMETKAQNNVKNESRSVSLGAILFF
ncbi:porin [Candidatus Methylopumilus rimovensis]|uniref:Porin n=1 Tax=Candidatus Methylopumilus rimovensis TaxID=2588535 RepID=A0AAE6KNN2_9PROT|nr:porin [Candidatus Methylopumilus rimovensis]QDD13034.1 porin [Candidatus Methylopumilus rimovensis]